MTDDETRSAFRFHGTWREMAPIVFTNLLLTIVTLGIYRFWATARERRYLWSRTDWIDDPLEWTGTGLELLIGFLLIALLLFVPLVVLQVVAQGLMVRGQILAAMLLFLSTYVALVYLFGLARYRALRYRLSRTVWRGIRGGSDDRGWGYAFTALWKTLAGFPSLGLLLPWSMTSLWNDRWGRLGFGDLSFGATAGWRPLFGRFLLLYLPPVGAFMMFALASGVASEAAGSVLAGAGIFGLYGGFLLLALVYYAAFLREAIGSLRLGGLRFAFTARTGDWIRLILGHVGLVVVTLGIGLLFIGYRNWAFFIRHLEASGEFDAAGLGQSTAAPPRQGEGLLDAFDAGVL